MKNTADIHFTRHAAQRQQQRGISMSTLDLLCQYGRRIYDHRGGYRLIFDKRSQTRIRAVLGKAAAQVKFSVYAVVDTNAPTVITLGHVTERVKVWC